MTKDEKLKKFVERLTLDSNTLSVILFGSEARGDSAPQSDIDLVVILKEGYKRAAEYFEDQAFEIIYTTEQAAVEYWQKNKHDAVGLWTVARILFDRDGTGERLRGFGKKLCQELPPEVDTVTLNHLRFDFEDSSKAIERIKKEDLATASLLVHKKVASLIDVYFDLQRVWRPAPKQQLKKILNLDVELGQLLEAFYTSASFEGQVILAEKIGTQILG